MNREAKSKSFSGSLLVLLAVTWPGLSAVAGEQDAGGLISAHAKDSSVVVGGATQGRGGADSIRIEKTAQAASSNAFKRLPQTYCGTLDPTSTANLCIDGATSGVRVRTCEDGSTALDPLFRRPVDPATGLYLGPWEQVNTGGCPEDPTEAVVLTAEEFRRLPLAASAPTFQPADGRGLVNVDLIAYTDPAPQVLTTTVLGVPVTVRATPVQYSWDFGDGSPPVITSDPGAPYPAHTVAHPYPQPGAYTVVLVTTWRGEYQVAGSGPWLPVAGTAQTTSQPFTTEAVEARAHLVAGAVG